MAWVLDYAVSFELHQARSGILREARKTFCCLRIPVGHICWENRYRFIQPPMHMHKGRKKPFGAYKRQTIHRGNLVRKFAAIRTNCETIRKPIACHIDEKQMAPLGPEMLMAHSRSHEQGLSKPNKHTRMRTHLRKHRPAQCKGNRCQRCGHSVFVAVASSKPTQTWPQ